MYYVKGNHDKMMRKFAGLKMGSLTVVNKHLNDGEKAWLFQ
ncbi:MAG: hypothetical protein ABIQ31_17430 [Ferruginibacter sp.]